MADALNNLSDASSNVVSLIGFRLAAKAPDAEHPLSLIHIYLHSDTLDTVRAREGAQVLAMSTCSTEFTDARTILLAWMTTPEQ